MSRGVTRDINTWEKISWIIYGDTIPRRNGMYRVTPRDRGPRPHPPTTAHMREAFDVLDTWGFAQKTILTWVKDRMGCGDWVKDRMGCGDWLRGKTEHCLLAIKGKPVITLTNQTSVLFGPMRNHSQKPDEFYDLVESLCPAPEGGRVELFQGKPRPGWIGHGGSLVNGEAA